MIIALQYILTLFFGYKILKTNAWERFMWYLSGITLVSTLFNFSNVATLLQGHIIFVMIFLVSLFFEGKLKLKYIKQCPLFVPLLLLFISYLSIGLFDDRINPLMGLYRGVYNYLIMYGALFLGWLSTYGDIDYNNFTKRLINVSLIFTIYGVFTYIIKSNPVVDALGYADRFVFQNAVVSFRAFLVSGFLAESGVYGLSCFLFFMLISVFGSHNRKERMLAMFLLCINLFLTGTRSIMIPSLIGFFIYIIFGLKVNQRFRVVVLGIAMYVIITLFFPTTIGGVIGELIDAMLDTILPSGSGGADLGGSTVDARDMQITAAFTKYLPQNLYFGHGFNYYIENILVWNNGVNDEELLGMESYLCYLGVEYGLINILTVIIFYVWLIYYIIKNRFVDKNMYILLLCVVVTYIIYLVTAFMGDSWLYAMPIIGLLIGIVEQKKKSSVNL